MKSWTHEIIDINQIANHIVRKSQKSSDAILIRPSDKTSSLIGNKAEDHPSSKKKTPRVIREIAKLKNIT